MYIWFPSHWYFTVHILKKELNFTTCQFQNSIATVLIKLQYNVCVYVCVMSENLGSIPE